MTISIADDAAALLEQAANQEGLSRSAMTEKAIRLVCVDYAPHRIDMNLLDRGRVSIGVERMGRQFYGLRQVERYRLNAELEAAVVIDTPGPIRPAEVVAALKAADLPESVAPKLSLDGSDSGVAIELIRNGRLDRASAYGFLLRAADAVGDLELTSFREVALHKCPKCGSPMVSKQVWALPGEPRSVEWVCFVGHRTGSATQGE